MLTYSDEAEKILAIIEEARTYKYNRFTLLSDLSDFVEQLLSNAAEDYNNEIAELTDRVNELESELDEAYDDLHDAESALEKYEEDE